MKAKAHRHRCQHHKAHRAALARRRQNNGQEHTVDSNAQRRADKLRQQRAGRGTQEGSQGPADPRRQHQAVQVVFPDLSRLAARHREDLIRVRDSLTDLYGAIPSEVENLLRIAVLKARAKKFSISEIYIRGGEAGIVLTGVNALKDGRLQAAAEAYRGAVTLTFDRQPTFVFRLKNKNPDKYLALLSDFLKTAAKSLKKS